MTVRRWLVVFVTASLALPCVTLADDVEAPEPQVETEVLAPPTDEPSTGRVTSGVAGGWTGEAGGESKHDWSDRTPWGYGTDYLFPLTRGLTDSEVPLWGKIPVYPLAVIVDTLQLPLGAIGGIWGS